MRASVSRAVAAAGLLLAAALTSCSHGKKETAAAPPAPPPEPTAAERSQASFQRAAEEQKALGEQQKRVEASHAAVIQAQDQLTRAQAQEEQERARAQQLQQQTSQHLKEGVQQAQRAQSSMAGGNEGLQTVAGSVTQTSPTQVAIQTPGGRAMTFAVDSRTRVLIGNETHTITDVQRGADAQVAYDPTKSGQMNALIIRVMPAGTGAASQGQQQQQQHPQPQQVR